MNHHLPKFDLIDDKPCMYKGEPLEHIRYATGWSLDFSVSYYGLVEIDSEGVIVDVRVYTVFKNPLIPNDPMMEDLRNNFLKIFNTTELKEAV